MHVQELVAEKLGAHDGEFFLFAGLGGLPRSEPTFEALRDGVVDRMTLRLGARLQDRLRGPVDLRRIDVGTWQSGFTDVEDDDQGRTIREEAFAQLQDHGRGYLSSQRWRDCLAAIDRPERWVALGREHEREGWLVEANICFAAARWLDPAIEPAIAAVTAARSPRLPRWILDQPSAEFPRLPFAKRHWQAWASQNRRELPTLLRWECDRNFSIRARIYRSLGQAPHPAAIQALHEGTYDPHPFARAQAVRSLGWCADPTGVEHLLRLAVDDPHPEVRRTAVVAVQRIIGFWMFFGQWNAIAGDPREIVAVVRTLAELGLPCMAWDVAVRLGGAGEERSAELDALADALADDLPRPGFTEDERNYHHWFADAQAFERSGHQDMSFEAAVSAAAAVGAAGFEARRTLRELGLGTRDQRRAAPAAT